MAVEILTGDCRDVLKTLADRSVHCIVTSPPYWWLRNYDAAAQIGMETTPAAFVEQLVTVFHECRRVLRDDGCLWLNLGDTANNRSRIRSTSHQPSLNGFTELTWAEATKQGLTKLSINDGDLKEKDMCGVPWAVAFALRRDGWYLRQEIIWAKNFGKPEPSFDRLPSRHEQLFLLSKSKRHYFDRTMLPPYASGSVWQIPPTGRSDHGASFSAGLVAPCILAGCPKGGTVLDPFFGAGTSGLVADRLGRNCIGIELNPAYVEIARNRLVADAGIFGEVA
jgi:site-specific DNA-methyltransferase (cytosine-N4-specific)